MPNQELTFEANAKVYTVRFTQNALYRVQKALGQALREITAQAGVVEIQTLLWAGLEGARLKRPERKEPFTLDEVGDIIDDLGGLNRASEIVAEALQLIVPGSQRQGAAEVASDETPFRGAAKQ
jgi:hypothetical protein